MNTKIDKKQGDDMNSVSLDVEKTCTEYPVVDEIYRKMGFASEKEGLSYLSSLNPLHEEDTEKIYSIQTTASTTPLHLGSI